MKKIHLTRNKLNELAKPRLIDLMLERLEYERLIEEGKDPRELLHYKYQNVPSEVIDAVIDIDPTKKKSYSQWLLSHWDTESKTITRNLNNGRLEQLFDYFKNNNDVQIRSYGSVGAPLQEFIPDVEDDEEEEEEPMHNILTKSDAPTTILHNHGWTKQVPSELANDFDIVFNEDDWIIAVPNTYEADCKLGENMYWCTAGGRTDFNRGRDYYNRYLNDSGGRYYVNFDMTKGESRLGVDYPFTRYQFHFESHQFMDKEDEPVELNEIGMPESAKDFYISKGYDEKDFVDIQTRMEIYDEQRWGVSYRLNDELWLNIEYDDDFEFTEPDENTDYYIFDENDDRDPISWDSVPNPNYHEDVVKFTSDWLCLLKYNDDEVLVVIKDNTGSSRWRSWEVYRCEQYIMLPNEIGVFGISEGKYTFFSEDGSESFNKLEISNSAPCEAMFINEPCTKADEGKWDRIFIETVTGGYHNLFALAPNDGMGNYFECLVRRDDPANGKCFTINEMGVIEGLYGKYRAYNEEDYEDEQTFTRYNLVERLPNGDCVISVDESYNENNSYREIKNILRNGEGEPLLSEWFNDFVDMQNGLYVVTKWIEHNKKFGYFNTQGMQVGTWYDTWGFINEGVAVGVIKNGRGATEDMRKCHFIDSNTSEIFAEFKELMESRRGFPKVIVQCNDGLVRGYDYIERKFCYNEFESMKRIISHCSSYLCSLNEDGTENVIFNYNTQKIEAENVSNITYLNRTYDIFKLLKTNGKYNAYDMSGSNGREVLPIDSDTDIQWVNGSILYTSNNRFFLYNYRKNKMILNPNGFDVEPFVDRNGYIGFTDGNYDVVFDVGDADAYFNYWKAYSQDPFTQKYGFIDENTPQEVVNLYNRVTGQGQQQPSQQQEPSYAYTEQFKRMVNRMMIAEKLNHHKRIID